MVDAGKNKLDGSLPPYSDEFMIRAGRAAVRYLNGFGITGWLDAAANGSVGAFQRASMPPGIYGCTGNLGFAES